MRPTFSFLAVGIDPFGCSIGPYRNHYISSHRPFFVVGEEGDGGGGDEGEGDTGYAPVELDDESVEPDATTGLRPKIKALGFKSGDQLVMLPGSKKPVKLSDLAEALSSKTKHDGGLKTMGEIATLLKKQQAGGGEGEKRVVKPAGGKVDSGDVQDAITKLEGMDLLDGKSAAAVMREFRDGTVTPLLKAVVAMAKEMKDLRGHVGNSLQRDGEANFSTEINGAIESLQLPRIGGKPIEGEDILKEITRDLYLSYSEEDQPKLKGETLHKLVKERVSAILKFAKAYQKSELEAGRLRMREQRFIKPGMGVAPNGKPRKVLSNKAAAEMLFAGSGDSA